MKKLNKKGFTLTELIVVIAVIAILAAVLIPTLTGYIEKARISADNQEVAVLNKLLLDAKINEVEFKDVNDLKKYLAEEMDYDGDYTLGVKDSYLWFDTESYEFVIKSKSDVEKLELATKEYKRATTLKSPEGLLVTGEYEVWLVGGKGEWVEAVEAIRNLGESENLDNAKNTIANIITKLDIDNPASLFANLAFVGSTGNVYKYDGDTLIDATQADDSLDGKNAVISNTIINAKNNKKAFHDLYVTPIIKEANENTNFASFAQISCDNEQNNDGSFNVKINLLNVDDNTQAELSTIFSVVTVLINHFTQINKYQYQSNEFYVSLKPNIDSEKIVAENISEDIIKLADLILPVYDDPKAELMSNILNGMIITYGSDMKNEILLTAFASAKMTKNYVFEAKNINLNILANSEPDLFDNSNELVLKAKFGDSEVVYYFDFVDASK